MKSGLIAACLVLLLLVVLGLIYWRPQPISTAAESVPSAPSPTEAALASEPLSSSPPVESAPVAAVPAAPSDVDRDRRAIEEKAAPKVVTKPPPEEFVIPVVDRTVDAQAPAESGIPPAEREFLAKKYATTSARDRLLARQTLEAVLAANKAGTLPKGQEITHDQAQAYGQEIAWLNDNPRP